MRIKSHALGTSKMGPVRLWSSAQRLRSGERRGSGKALAECTESTAEARHVERAPVMSAQRLRLRRGTWRGLRRGVQSLTPSKQIGSGMAPAKHTEALAEARHMERALARCVEAHTE